MTTAIRQIITPIQSAVLIDIAARLETLKASVARASTLPKVLPGRWYL